MNLIILNLPRKMQKHELVALFDPFGKTANAEIVLDQNTGKSKGFGFIAIETEDAGAAAIAALHNTKIGHNTIRVKEAK